MNIEKAEVKDLEEILSLQKLAYISEAEICNDYSIPPLVQTLESLREDYENKLILKAVINGKIVGSVRAYENEGTCHIGRLFVHPEYQNKGIGTQLIKCIEEKFKASKRFELFTSKKSVKNIYLYNKLGYKNFREEQDNEIAMVYMEKSNVTSW
ncbi:MAG: GNAT family N-acetyltransferase [Firmicutes bacterium]|jgi:ribosomal protein S18 acetylase RimI-like enzyme|nr:GNAT family N-acetyltransferase [Bacillota bacterium]